MVKLPPFVLPASTCDKSVSCSTPERPELSIAAGKHFGKACHLPKLSWREQQMLDQVRTTGNVVKLVPKGTLTSAQQLGVRGHSISIPD